MTEINSASELLAKLIDHWESEYGSEYEIDILALALFVKASERLADNALLVDVFKMAMNQVVEETRALTTE